MSASKLGLRAQSGKCSGAGRPEAACPPPLRYRSTQHAGEEIRAIRARPQGCSGVETCACGGDASTGQPVHAGWRSRKGTGVVYSLEHGVCRPVPTPAKPPGAVKALALSC